MCAKTFSGDLNDGRAAGSALLIPSVLVHDVTPADFQSFCSVVLNEINSSSALDAEERKRGNLYGSSNAWVGSQRAGGCRT